MQGGGQVFIENLLQAEMCIRDKAHPPQESGYLDTLLGRDGITHDIDTWKKQAAEQLYTLLHDFSGFNISTIDRFFQQITRAFMHEIGYSGGYNIELDSTHVLTEAVDNLFFDLEKKENKELLKWLVDYARQQVEEDSYKNFRNCLLYTSRDR